MIDGTQDAGGRVTYRAIAYRWRGPSVTVHAQSLVSENEEDLARFLETVRLRVGTPRLIVRDFGSAAKAACTRAFPHAPQAGCHWHFLKDAGTALLDDAYQGLRKTLLATRHLAVLERSRDRIAQASAENPPEEQRALRTWTRLLLEHILSARDHAGGFPLKLAYHELLRRVRDARKNVEAIVRQAQAWNVHEPSLTGAKEELDRLWGDMRVRDAFLSVDRRWDWFSRLRVILRLEDAGVGHPAEPTEPLDRASVRQRVQALTREASGAPPQDAAAWQRVWSRFLAHERELFPRTRLRHAPRTTAVMEAAHREDRRDCRRRSGTVSTRGPMERVGEHLAVWSNATNPWFVENALCGVDLVAEFAQQDPKLVLQGLLDLRRKAWRGRLPVENKAREGLLDRFVELAQAGAPREAFSSWADEVEAIESPGE